MEIKAGIFEGISNREYHADRKAASSTWLKILDEKTPRHLRSYLDSPPTEPSDPLKLGAATDCLVFEPLLWNKQFIVAPEINRRTNVGKKDWADLIAKGIREHKYVLSNKLHSEALEMAKAIRLNPVMADLLAKMAKNNAVAQQVIIWRDPVTGLWCKCRSDLYDAEEGILYDLKTAQHADPIGFGKAIGNFRYHIQAAFYTDGYLAAGLPVNKFVFGVMEKPDNRHILAPDPDLMAWYELTPEEMVEGQDTYTSALSAINFCMMNNEWAGYTNHVTQIQRPGWARKGDVEKVTSL